MLAPITSPIQVRCPATIANLICGYDVLGLCVHDPYDVLTLQCTNTGTVTITSNHNQVPLEPTSNTAGVALLAMMQQLPAGIGFAIHIHKNILPGSGLGSSAASAAGAVVAANIALHNMYTPLQLVYFAMQGEKAASGVAHADNVAPCIYGGITLITSNNPLQVVSLPTIPLYISIVHPQVQVRTADARSILQPTVPLSLAVTQWGIVAGVVAALYTQDIALLASCMHDVIIEPQRKILIPYYDAVKQAGLQAGAIAGGIAGSGPTIYMLSSSLDVATQVTQAMEQVYTPTPITVHSYTTSIATEGARCIA